MATASISEVQRLLTANDLAVAIAQAIAAALTAGLTVEEIKSELERAGNLIEE